MNILTDKWIINEPLDIKRREVLIITLEAAGFGIGEGTRTTRKGNLHTYIGLNHGKVDSWQKHNGMFNDKIAVSYDEVIEKLHKIIKNERD